MAAATSSPALVVRGGQCSGPSHWTLAVRGTGANLHMRYLVAGGAPDQRWNVFADHNDAFLFAVSRRSGDGGWFAVTRVVANLRGRDRIRVEAQNRRTGEICSSGVSF